jgi:periplasmic protein CpxP/Spy
MREKKENKKCKGNGKLWIGLVAGLLWVGIAASAVGCGRHHFMGNHDSERIEKMVMWKVDDVLDDLDAADTQRAEIEGIAREILADGFKLKEGHGKHKGEMMAKFRAGTYDRVEMNAKLDEHFEMAQAFIKRSMNRILDAYETLDESQRNEILDRMQAHMDEH